MAMLEKVSYFVSIQPQTVVLVFKVGEIEQEKKCLVTLGN